MKNIVLMQYGVHKVVNHWNIDYSYRHNRIYKIHGGAAYFMFRNQKYPFKKDYFYLLPQTADITFFNDQDDPIDHTFLGFYLDQPLLLDGPIILDLHEYPLINHVMDYFTLLHRHRPQPADDRYESMAGIEFNNLILLLEQQLGLTYAADTRIADILQFIHNHYAEPITIPQLAGLVHMEPTYFIRFFKHNMNTTPHQYLKDFRLNMAVTLLKSGSSVTETALQTGYSTVSAFSNTFKKQTGVYPSEIVQTHP